MRHNLCKVFILIGIYLLSDNSILAASDSSEDVAAIDFEQNLEIPAIKEKYKAAIIIHQKKIGEQYYKQGYKVETTRKGEVLIISIPAHLLFDQNGIDISPKAAEQLSPILSLAQNKQYKLLLSMHSDNTGSEQYTDDLTNNRIIAVLEWFKENGTNLTVIVPYAMGQSEPLLPNNSKANRQINRRLEIFVVPNELMINRAKNNTLN